MKKTLTISLAVMAGIVFLFMALVVAVSEHYVWQLHPWVPAGQALTLGHWRFGDCEFQVWQRKNTSLTEPFADGLFVRQGTNQWQAFCFDIQDRYRPRVSLAEEHGQIVVYRDGKNRGAYDLLARTFRQHGQICSSCGLGASVNPPGEWWLR